MRGRTPQIRRILRRKRIKRAIKAYGNYIAAGLLAVVVIVFTVGGSSKASCKQPAGKYQRTGTDIADHGSSAAGAVPVQPYVP